MSVTSVFKTEMITQWTETLEEVLENDPHFPDYSNGFSFGIPRGFDLVGTHVTTVAIGNTIVHTVFATFQRNGDESKKDSN